MIVGVPTEVKTREYRVGMIPAGVRMLTTRGHRVLVQAGAGLGSGIPDDKFQAAGAEIVAAADEVWARADLIFKQPHVGSQLRCGVSVIAADEFVRQLLHVSIRVP